ETIKWISEHDESHIPIMMYELKLFAKGGIAPVIDKCVNCGENETSLFAFSIREGGLLCQKCVHLDQHSVPLTNVLVKLRSEEHTSELQSRFDLVCRLLLEKKKIKKM